MPMPRKATATQALGAGASKADIEAKTNEIKTAKYTEIETLMLKDTTARPDVSSLSMIWPRRNSA